MAEAVTPPEFSRPVRAHEVGGRARRHTIEADASERAALAARFDLLALDRLVGRIDVLRSAEGIRVTGEIEADGTQACVATGEPVPFTLAVPLALKLVETLPDADEMELDADDLDTEPLTGDIIDLGEWAAQALALALDPYPRSSLPAPGVVSEEEAAMSRSPFSVLKGQ
jgi:uncharacterized metal-binding protein YceD (DUF177 family)